MANENALLTLWRKMKKNGEAFYSGEVNLDGKSRKVTIWIDREAMTDPNCKRPAIKMVEDDYKPQTAQSEIHTQQANDEEPPF